MKSMKAVLIIIMIMSIFFSYACAESDDYERFYPKLAIVTEYERVENSDVWIIYVTDSNGQVWSFYGEEEDAHIGAMFNILMYRVDDNEEHDEIIELYYIGDLSIDSIITFLP